LICSS